MPVQFGSGLPQASRGQAGTGLAPGPAESWHAGLDYTQWAQLRDSTRAVSELRPVSDERKVRVRTVVDLRDANEREPDRAPRPAGITTVHVPLDPVGTPFYEHWRSIDNTTSPLYYHAMLAEQPQLVIAAVRAIASAAPGCVVFHCAGGKDRTGLLALVLLTLAGTMPGEIIADYLLSYDRLKKHFDAVGARDQLTAVTELLACHGTTIEASLTSTIASLSMPDFLLQNGLSETELATLCTRLTSRRPG